MTKGKIDVEGLRVIEAQLQPLASLINVGLNAVVEGWGFFVLVFEFEGEGSGWVGSIGETPNLPARLRREVELLRGTAVQADGQAASISPRQAEHLGTKAAAIGDLIHSLTPPGWGYFLLLFSKTARGFVWASNGEREDLPDLLEEFVRKLEGGESRPPGALGREH